MKDYRTKITNNIKKEGLLIKQLPDFPFFVKWGKNDNLNGTYMAVEGSLESKKDLALVSIRHGKVYETHTREKLLDMLNDPKNNTHLIESEIIIKE